MLDVAAHAWRKRWLPGAAVVALTMATAGTTPGVASDPMRHFDIPALGTCIDGGQLTVRVRPARRFRWVRATVWINGKKVRTLKGKRITKPLTLTGLDTPVIVLTLSAGSYGRLAGVIRSYRACWAIPKDGRYSGSNGSGIAFSLTDGGTRIRDVSGDVSLLCTSVGGAVERVGIAEVPVGAGGLFSSVTTRTGQFRGSDATFTYTFDGGIQGIGFAGTYRVDVVYDGGASKCASAVEHWSATPAAP